MIERAKELSGLSFLRALILSIGAPPWGPNHLSKVPPLHTITSGMRFQPMNLGGHRYSVCIILYHLTSTRLSITAWRQVMPVLGVQQSGDGGTALVVQWIRLHASTVADTVSITSWGTKIPCHVVRPKKKKVVMGLGCRSTLDSASHVCWCSLQPAWGKGAQGPGGGELDSDPLPALPWSHWAFSQSYATLHMHHPSARRVAILFSSLFTFQCDPPVGRENLTSVTRTARPTVRRLSHNGKPPFDISRFTTV